MKVSVLSSIVLAMAVNFLTAENTLNNVDKNTPQNSLEGEFLLDTSWASVPGIGEQRQPAVSFDGTNYLVAWTDYRNGAPIICAGQMDQDGNDLDDVIFMPYSGGYQCSPAVAFDGTNYLVVWLEKKINHGNEYEIHGARVNIDGSVIDTMSFIINRHAHGKPMAIFGGGIFFIVWVSNDWSWRISGARVTTSGMVLDTAGVDYGGGMHPSVASSGNNFLIVTKRGNYNWGFDIIGYLIDLNGSLLDSTKIFKLPSMFWYPQIYIYSPRIAFDGANFFVVWDTRDTTFNDFDTNIWGARVSQAGVVIDTNSILITNNEAGQFSPDVVYNGQNYLVTWIDRRNEGSESYDIYGTRVNPNGIVLDPNGICISNQSSIQSKPTVGTGNGRFFVAWQDQQIGLGSTDIKVARVTPVGTVIDTNGIAYRKSIPGCQSSSSVAFDGTNYMAVWRDARSASFPLLDCDIYGIRLDENGNAVDDHAFPIALGPDEIIDPLICYGGSQYLVIYGSWFDNDTEKLAGLMVATDGTISDSFIISEDILSGTGSSYSVAFGDTVFLVVWNQNDFVKASRISQSGLVLDPGGFVVDSYIHGIVNSNVIYGDSNFMVLWHCGWPGSLFAKRIAIDGSIIDTIPIHITNTVLWNDEYSLAFGGGNYLIVWSHYLDIFGCRISQSGVVIDTCIIIISDLPFMERSPAVEYDGTNYGIVWEVSADSFSYDLYGAKVNSQGQVVNRFPVVTARGDQVEPVMARGSGDRMLLTYNGWTPYINSHPAGTDRIWGKLYPFTGLQETPAAVNVGLDFLTTRPNPFRDRIEFQLSPGIAQSAERRELTIYDVSGRLIRSFALCPMLSALCWDGTDQSGRKVSAGIYFVRLTAPHRELIQKIILLK